MEDSWRFRPLQGNNICPICSISHFPFCYQPLPLNRFANDPAFNRPVLDPFSGNRGMPRPLPQFDNRGGSMRPFSGNSNHSLNRNQNFEGDLFWQRSQTSQWPDSALVNGVCRDGLQPIPGFGGNGVMREEFVESDRTRKRMRVGEMDDGSFVHRPPTVGGYSANPARMLSEDERRLSLIRDHGAPPSVKQSHGGYMSVNESNRSDWQPTLPSNNKMNSFMDPRFGSAGRMGPMLNFDPAFNPQYHAVQSNVYDEKKEMQRGGYDLGFDQHQMPINMGLDMDSAVFRNREESGKDSLFASQKEQSQQSDNGQINFKHPSLESHGHSNHECEPAFVATGAANYVSHAQHIQDSSVVRGKDEHRHRGDHPFIASRKDVIDQHSHAGHQQFLPEDFNQGNEVQHPRVSNLTVSSGSSIPVGEKHNLHFHDLRNDTRHSFEVKHRSTGNIKTSLGPHNLPIVEKFGVPTMNKPGAYLPISTSNNMVLARQSQLLSSKTLGVRHPLPPLPPHPLPLDSSGGPPLHLHARSSPTKISSMYPAPTTSTVIVPLNSSALEGQPFPLKHPSPDKPKVVDATCLFLPPHRATRPDHIVIILRGLPGSGKSYLAKMLRDLEVENGGSAPRIHSMDDYFMTEVEKVEEVDSSKSSSMVKGKKSTTKKVMEYCYEPEMEEAYRSSMLKAFKKTLEEGNFTFVIVDDRNLRVADFAQFWASAKRSGYEVYLLQAMYKDPVGCAARNVHGFTSDDIHKMAELWEDASSLYLQLDVQSLFRGDNMKESDIQEVDMDMEDVTCGEDSSELSNNNSLKVKEPLVEDYACDDSFKDERWDSEGDDTTRVKELGRSKWSHDEDEEDYERPKGARGNTNALSGLIQAYSRGEKSVHWGDQVGKTGFSIGAAKKANSLSLVIGPGAGYNLKSNPLPEEENMVEAEHGWESKKRSVFEEQLRAERESFRAVFDRRRHRIGGLEMEEE